MMNPFKRSKHSLEETLAVTARDIADVAEAVARGFEGDTQPGRRAPKRAAGAATFLGLTYVAAQRFGVAAAVAKKVEDVRGAAPVPAEAA